MVDSSICRVGSDVLAVHPGAEGQVRLRRDDFHTDLRHGGCVELPRGRAPGVRARAGHYHRRRRRHLPLHHRLHFPDLGRGGPPQARRRQPRQTGGVP